MQYFLCGSNVCCWASNIQKFVSSERWFNYKRNDLTWRIDRSYFPETHINFLNAVLTAACLSSYTTHLYFKLFPKSTFESVSSFLRWRAHLIFVIEITLSCICLLIMYPILKSLLHVKLFIDSMFTL